MNYSKHTKEKEIAMKLKLRFLIATFIVLSVIYVPTAQAQARLKFSGGGGTPLTVTLENTVTYTLTSNCASGPIFVFQNVGRIFLFSPDFPANGDPAFPFATGNISYRINGGAAQFVDQEVNGIAAASVNKPDFGFYRGGQPGATAGSTIVLSPGTITTTTNVSGTPPTGSNLYPTFITNASGVRCDAAVTAAAVSISGRVLINRQRGLSNATVYLSDPEGNTRMTRTNLFGYYSFQNVQAGQSVMLRVVAKRYQFAPQVINVHEEMNNFDFIAEQ